MLNYHEICTECGIKNCNEYYVGCNLKKAREREREYKKQLAEQGKKQCSVCGQIKLLSEFWRRKKGYQSQYKDCARNQKGVKKIKPPREIYAGKILTCRICGQIKDSAEFYGRATQTGWRSECISCFKKLIKERRRKNVRV